MRTTFGGLNTALRALQAQQLATEVIGHNIANANTPGYSPQVRRCGRPTLHRAIELRQRRPRAGRHRRGCDRHHAPANRLLDQRFRSENQTLGYWSSVNTGLGQWSSPSNEPSDTDSTPPSQVLLRLARF